MNTLTWPMLICHDRPFKAGKISKEDEFRTPYEADFDRVIYSELFRRLAKKTQVHPLAANDHVHNRLTHSLEVSCVGRSLGRRLIDLLRKKGISGDEINDLPSILQVGCLVHDIGNPPFGHAGEYAIRKWFEKNRDFAFNESHGNISEDLKIDCLKFEGNAQGFRMASRSDNPKCGYIRLTFASLGAMVKYPWGARSEMAKNGKFNYYNTESDIFSGAFDKMGLRLNDNRFARHPLSFLSEAADDICYRMLDMEDAVSMSIFPEKPIKDLFYEIAEIEGGKKMPLTELRGRAIKKMIEGTWQVFEDNYDIIMAGGRFDDLKSGLSREKSELMKRIKGIYDEIFSHRSKVAYELGAYNCLGRILDCMFGSVQNLCGNKSYENSEFITKRCLELTWGREYVVANEKMGYSWWISQIVDYVAGLTDNYAMQVSKEIDGV